jgi:ABC-type multidrug transport system permease subunit
MFSLHSPDGICAMNKRPLKDHPLWQLSLVRFREFIREPEAVFWTFLFPILLATGLGIAFRNRAPEKPHIGIVQGMPGSETLMAALSSDSAFVIEQFNDSSAKRALRTAAVALLLVPHKPDSIEYRFDPARSEARTARLMVDQAIQKAAGRQDPVRVAETRISEKGSRYIDFVIPGLLGMNLMGSGIWGIAFSIVTARNKRLLKRLMATPMSRAHYLSSYLISRLLFLIFEVASLLGFAALIFGVPMRGSLVTLSLVCLVASVSFGALGLLISSRARTTEGVSGITNLVMMPMWIFSGVFFASSNFPKAVQPIIHALPLTAVNDALRANMLEGATLSQILPQMGIVALWGIASFVAALKLFRWR